MSWSRLARLRVPLGFAAGALVLWLASPTWRTLAIGVPIAVLGQALRVWAAGHLEKNREVTSSGPYRVLQHPLYAGSAVMALGLVVASAHLIVAVLIGVYVLITFTAAIRTEQTFLASAFGSTYAAYRSGRRPAPIRRFSWQRAFANREHRSVAGFLIVVALLAWKAS